ncbi:MAG: TetR family transcriptional regulator C-terminal domain-containing protein [Haloarculaceae archaeon]
METGDADDRSADATPRPGDADDRNPTQQAIMEATCEAMVTHGYADLTIQRIADCFPKSKSLLYYHYDAKADIILDFLSYLLDEFERELDADQPAEPREALEEVFDLLAPRTLDDDERALRVAMIELQAQAARDEQFRERYADLTAGLRAALRRAVADGVEAGVFRSVDPDREATHLFSMLLGASVQQATVDPDATERVRAVIDDYVERALVA